MREIRDLLWLTADKKKKLDYLRSRPENQVPEREQMIRTIERLIPEREDAIIPWIFREMTRGRLPASLLQMSGASGKVGDYLSEKDYTWEQFFSHTYDYLEQKRPEIMRMTTDDVVAALQEWDEELREAQELAQSEQYEEHEVVHSFGDGWTIQRVQTAHDLELEGELMGHCVGGYCHQVNNGDSYIYSLRDPKNRPHVTIELNEDHESKDGAVVRQIQGKEDKEPIPEYRKRVDEWLDTTSVAKVTFTKLLKDLHLNWLLSSHDVDESIFGNPHDSAKEWIKYIEEDDTSQYKDVQAVLADFDDVLSQYIAQAVPSSLFEEFKQFLYESDFDDVGLTNEGYGWRSSRNVLERLESDWNDWIDNADYDVEYSVRDLLIDFLESCGISIDENNGVSGNLEAVYGARPELTSGNAMDKFLQDDGGMHSEIERKRENALLENAVAARQEVLWTLATICSPNSTAMEAFKKWLTDAGYDLPTSSGQPSWDTSDPRQMELPFDARRAFAELLGFCSLS